MIDIINIREIIWLGNQLHKNISKPLSLLVARVNPSVKDKEVPHSTMKISLFYKILWLNLTKDSLFKAWDDLWFLHSKWQIIFNSLIKTHLEQNQIDVIQLRTACTFPYLPKNTSDQPTGLTVRLPGLQLTQISHSSDTMGGFQFS